MENDYSETNVDGTYTQTSELPLYVPDDDDRLAAVSILASRSALPDDLYSQLDEEDWLEINADIAAKRQSDPAYDSAMEFIETEGNDMLLAMALGTVTEFGVEATFAKLFTAVRAAQTTKLLALRKEYVNKVKNLADEGVWLELHGKSSEEVARTLHAARRQLGIEYKHLTPQAELEKIYARNIEKYGDKLGPSIEFLRNEGKSWDDIIYSAARPSGADLGYISN